MDEAVLEEFENWSEARAALAEAIWGDGFINPGTGKFLRKCMSSARVNKKKTVLEIGPGLGGTAIMLAREWGIWVDGMEPNPSLVQKARQVVARTPVGSQIDIQEADFANLEIPAEKYHVIYSRERLFASRFKREVIEQVANGLKPGGQFFLMDYVVTPGRMKDPEVHDWMTSELDDIHPWELNTYLSTLEESGFEVPKPDDFSEAMANEINSAWNRMLLRLEAGVIDRDLVNLIVVEGSIWQKRVKALRSGGIQLLRINATWHPNQP